MKNLNEQEDVQRKAYDDLKRQLDIVIQPLDEYFDYELSEAFEKKMPFVTYKNDTDVEKQGVYQRFYQEETIGAMKDKIERHMKKGEIELIEVCKDSQNGKLRFLRKLSQLDGEKTIEETNTEHKDTITHLSTWLMIKKDDSLVKHIDNYIGESILPVKLNLKVLGDEAELLTFSNLNVEDLLKKLNQMTGISI